MAYVVDIARRFINWSIDALSQELTTKIAGAVIAFLIAYFYSIMTSFTTCQILQTIDHGAIQCIGNPHNYSNGSVCEFTCDDAYRLVGAEKAICDETGNWTHELPTCVRSCEKPPEVEYGTVKCNDTVVGSVCTVECDESRETKGTNYITCEQNGEWSHSFPKCICTNQCRTGNKCDKLLSWDEFKHHIHEGKGSTVLDFAGNQMKCASRFYIKSFKLKWSCKCIDIRTGINAECKNYEGGYGSCEHASAELIRRMVETGDYSNPCDPDKLMTGCK